MTTRTDRDQVFGPDGLISETVVQRDVTVEVNSAAVRTQLATALANLQAIIDTADLPAGTLTTLQLSNAARQLQTAVKALARNQRRLIRAAVNVYDGAD